MDELFEDVPEGLCVYYCPICCVTTGERSWHPVGHAGLIPQTQDEHDCVKIDVSGLIRAIREADRRVSTLHDLMYDRALPERATEASRSVESNLVWEIHEILRGAA